MYTRFTRMTSTSIQLNLRVTHGLRKAVMQTCTPRSIAYIKINLRIHSCNSAYSLILMLFSVLAQQVRIDYPRMNIPDNRVIPGLSLHYHNKPRFICQ